jgi:CYTH domain-containing protein
MKIEIERKFRLRNDGWRDEVIGVERLRDGLVGEFEAGEIRVRLGERHASLAIKSPASGLARREFEYSIPRSDAEFLLAAIEPDLIVEKLRYRVFHRGFEWSVDVYEKQLAGIALAEIELDRTDRAFSLPPRVGREVTDDPRFHKRNMMRSAPPPRALRVARLGEIAQRPGAKRESFTNWPRSGSPHFAKIARRALSRIATTAAKPVPVGSMASPISTLTGDHRGNHCSPRSIDRVPRSTPGNMGTRASVAAWNAPR